MGVVVAVGLVVVAERDVNGECVAGAGEGDVEEAASFLEPFGAGAGRVGGEVAVAGADHVHGVPFESFGGVDGAEDQVVVVNYS